MRLLGLVSNLKVHRTMHGRLTCTRQLATFRHCVDRATIKTTNNNITFKRTIREADFFSRIFSFLILICYLHSSTVYFSFYRVFIVLRAAVRALVSLAVLLGFTCVVAFVYFVYIYEQINDDDDDENSSRNDQKMIDPSRKLYT